METFRAINEVQLGPEQMPVGVLSSTSQIRHLLPLLGEGGQNLCPSSLSSHPKDAGDWETSALCYNLFHRTWLPLLVPFV